MVISASHNRFMDNGIKFFDAQGSKLSDDIERQIEERLRGSRPLRWRRRRWARPNASILRVSVTRIFVPPACPMELISKA